MINEKYQAYLESLGEVISEYAKEAKQKCAEAAPGSEKEFADGYLSAFYRIATLMQQHAEPYYIGMKELGLDGVDEPDLT
jgi:hypothetical protein